MNCEEQDCSPRKRKVKMLEFRDDVHDAASEVDDEEAGEGDGENEDDHEVHVVDDEDEEEDDEEENDDEEDVDEGVLERKLEDLRNGATELKWSNYNIGDEGAKAIAGVLEKYTALRELHLGHNNIGDEGAKAIAGALEKNTALTSFLDLGHNNIGDEGAKAIAGALENTALDILHLGDNNIGTEGAKAIAGALEKNTALTTLYLHENNIGDEGAKAFAGALEMHTALNYLSLRMNNIGDEGAKAIAGVLEKNTPLTYLSLYENNKIGYEGAKAIAGALEKNTALTTLYFSSTNVGAERIKEINDAMKPWRIDLRKQISRIAADFSTAALQLAQFRLLPPGLVAEFFASGLALKVFEDSTNGQAMDIDQERVCKLLIFEPLEKAFKDMLLDFIGETSIALAQGDQRNKRARTVISA